MINKPEIIGKVVNAPLEPHAKAVAKNKWLNPTDSFGKMKEGVVHESGFYNDISKNKKFTE